MKGNHLRLVRSQTKPVSRIDVLDSLENRKEKPCNALNLKIDQSFEKTLKDINQLMAKLESALNDGNQLVRYRQLISTQLKARPVAVRTGADGMEQYLTNRGDWSSSLFDARVLSPNEQHKLGIEIKLV